MDAVKNIALIYLGLQLVLLISLLLNVNVYKFYHAIFLRLPCFVVKKFLIAVPWIISAAGAMTVGFVALGRQFFTANNAKFFVERFLPPLPSDASPCCRKTFSLVLIELMLVFHAEIFSTARKVDDGFKSLKKIIDSNSN